VGWIVAAPVAIAAGLIGVHIRWQASQPGFGALGAFFEAAALGAVILVVAIVGAVLIARRRRRIGQVLLMAAAAAVLATGVGAAVGPTYRPPLAQMGQVELTLTEPEPLEVVAPASCDIPENSDTVRHVHAVSVGYSVGERISVSVAIGADGSAELVLARGQERAETPGRLPAYGAVAGSEVTLASDTDNRAGTVTFAGLGPRAAGPAWGLGADPVPVSGEVRWECAPTDLTFALSPRLQGAIELSGTVNASLDMTGECAEDRPMGEFSVSLSGKGPETAEGEPVAGSLMALDDGWELTLYRPGIDADAEIVVADRATFTRETDGAAMVDDRLEADFPMSYGTVSVIATWRCEAGSFQP
jgi:hypothetical protein